MTSTGGPMVELPHNHVHLWIGQPPSDPFVYRTLRPETVLSDDEQRRWRRLLRVDDRNLFAWSHIMLRHVLSRYYPIDPGAWHYRVGEHGRPEIADELLPLAGVDGLRFNMSHTPGLMAVIVNRRFDAGVDVERIGRVADIASVARTTCSPAEQSMLASLDALDRATTFAKIWGLKEAFVKATGQGGYVSIANYSFDPLPNGDVEFTTTDAAITPPAWTFTSSSEAENYLLTTACKPEQPGSPPPTTRFDLPTTSR